MVKPTIWFSISEQRKGMGKFPQTPLIVQKIYSSFAPLSNYFFVPSFTGKGHPKNALASGPHTVLKDVAPPRAPHRRAPPNPPHHALRAPVIAPQYHALQRAQRATYSKPPRPQGVGGAQRQRRQPGKLAILHANDNMHTVILLHCSNAHRHRAVVVQW